MSPISRESVAGFGGQTILRVVPLLGVAFFFGQMVGLAPSRADDKPIAKPSPLDRLDPAQIL
jgi:hypothetical protein